MSTSDLFALTGSGGAARETLGPDAVLLRGFALPDVDALLGALPGVLAAAPWRHMVTPGGHVMSVAMTNCGAAGWVSDRQGYRYQPVDPLSGAPWPALPASFRALAQRAAGDAGFPGFDPDACLVNRYAPGTKLTLHQDRNERDFREPIVSVSLGLPAIFLFGGAVRGDRTRRFRLEHGDVAVWGGASRLAFHGVAELAEGTHPLLGQTRVNLTFRCAQRLGGRG